MAFLSAYVLLSSGLGLLLVATQGPTELLILLSGPIIGAALFYPRPVYLSMILVSLIVSLRVAVATAGDLAMAMRTIGVLSLTTLAMAEVTYILTAVRTRAADGLRRRDAILGAVAFAAERFLRSDHWEQDIPDVLRRLGEATGASRVYIFENHVGENGQLLTSQRHEWVAPGVLPQIGNPDLQNFPLQAGGFSRWIEAMERGDPIYGHIRDFPAPERVILAAQDIRSIIVVPIFIGDDWWGFIGFDECQREREWSAAEREALRTAASTLAAAIQRREMQEAQARLATIIESTSDAVAIADRQGRLLYLNDAGRAMLGIGKDEDPSQLSLADMYPQWAQAIVLDKGIPLAIRDGTWSGETAFQTREGREIPISQVIIAHKAEGGRVEFLSTIARDMSEHKRFESQILHLTQHDPLTGLLNRRRFQEQLDEEMMEAPRGSHSGAVLMVDLDNFKEINDALGHQVGDEILLTIAGLLRKRLRETDLVARMSGDSFAIYLPQANAPQAQMVADHILELIRQYPFMVGGHPLHITASVGIALFPEHGATGDAVLAHADLAVYQAKEQGRNGVALYQQGGDVEARLSSRLAWERRLRDALEAERLTLYAQPILDLRTEHISRYEILVRMLGETGDLILPGTFLGVAERIGLIHMIDRWVVRQAIRLLASHQRAGRDLCLEVNLSGKAFADSHLLPMIRQELSSLGVKPSSLVLEITETAAIADLHQARSFIMALKDLGCRFAIDDFGVGFSSFDHIRRLPVDYLKIDGSFISNLPRDAIDQRLVRAIVDLAHSLDKETIAEFVGDEETLRLLREYRVDYAQGFHIGRPRPLAEALAA